MVAAFVKKIKHSMLCVTDVYVKGHSYYIFSTFVLVCESSEHFLASREC